ncbi:hypothetical protein ASR50_03235 [Streptomyces sp. 4F]|nr:hypothetical protein ASR50_03235 [Streptomyces sp. 4F]
MSVRLIHAPWTSGHTMNSANRTRNGRAKRLSSPAAVAAASASHQMPPNSPQRYGCPRYGTDQGRPSGPVLTYGRSPASPDGSGEKFAARPSEALPAVGGSGPRGGRYDP